MSVKRIDLVEVRAFADRVECEVDAAVKYGPNIVAHIDEPFK